MGFGAFMSKYLETIYSLLQWDLLNRFLHFALLKYSVVQPAVCLEMF